ncbi:MAG: saccharopine dehydrogenase [Cyanobacteria bacterium P01_F01_bin.150]
MMTQNSILIAGGYGVVGQQVATFIRQRYPELSLIIAGRNPEKAQSLAQELGNARGFQLDTEQPMPLQGIQPRAVVAVVNDPHDYLLMDAVRQGIPFLDVTRWTERLRESGAKLTDERLTAPVLFSSGWMGGIAAVLAVAATQTLQTVDRIDISVLFSTQDKSGPNSVDYMDRLATPFETMIDGQPKRVFPYTDPRTITFPNGYTTPVYRFDTPDQLTLPHTTGAKTVAARIAFDDAFSTNLLRFLTRSGIWTLISGDRFTSLRRSLLYNPGNGASHEIHITATDRDANGSAKTVTTTIVDPQGQTHLTALGTLIQLERLLGLDGAAPPAPDIVYPDTAPQIRPALQVLEQFGVSVSQVDDSAKGALHQPGRSVRPYSLRIWQRSNRRC